MLMSRVSGLVVAVVLAVSMLATNAHAQMFRAGMRGAMEADFTSKGLEEAAEILRLDDDQKMIAEELLKGYLVEWEELRGRMNQVMEGARQEFRETQDPSVWQDIQEVMTKFDDEKKAMTDRFVGDLKLTLTEEQLDRWPTLERQRRRAATMQNNPMSLSGEGVDVIALVKEMEFTPETMEGVAPILERYEVELDRALIERNEIQEKGMGRAMELWQNQDFDTMEKIFNEARDAGVKVRDANRRAAKQITSVLPEEQAALFEQKFKEASFPQVYRRSFAVRAFETANDMADLTTEQREQIGQMRSQLDRELATLNDKMAASIEKDEMERSIQGMMGMGRRGPGGDNAARQERRDYETKMVERLKSVLTPEQQALLPEPEQQRDWRRNFGGDGEDGGDRPRRRRGGEQQDGV